MNLMLPKIDVITCTWNSENHLDECLQAIMKNVSLNQLIIIDRNSNDSTIDICKKYDCKIIQNKLNLGQARKIGIENVKTETFAFVDSDYIVCDNWHEKLLKYWRDDIGMLSGTHQIISPYSEYERYRNYLLKFHTKLNFYPIGHGGGTENTLIRTNLVRDVEIDLPGTSGFSTTRAVTDVSGREDWIIAEHVKSKGFLVGNAPVISKHYTENPFKQFMWTGGSARRLKITNSRVSFPFGRSISNLVYNSIKWLIQKKDPKVSFMLFKFAMNMIRGYITNYGYKRDSS